MNERFFPISDVSRSLYPQMAHALDAGYDLFAQERVTVHPGQVTPVKTGWGVMLEPGEVGLVCPRSGLATRGITIVNSPGIIDAGYSGEIVVLLATFGNSFEIPSGMAVAQLLIMRHLDVNTDGDTRFNRGFGSSDG